MPMVAVVPEDMVEEVRYPLTIPKIESYSALHPSPSQVSIYVSTIFPQVPSNVLTGSLSSSMRASSSLLMNSASQNCEAAEPPCPSKTPPTTKSDDGVLTFFLTTVSSLYCLLPLLQDVLVD
eukprot:CAMPEP_0182498340 /NCGR_PEP_ID=MMETSP1321-20130603/6563_1 /TAXON_ID=91990 /ORGANISM="Bolidomonas sp., Strain RCC1657" /LENGTH=121 /DNA_ID=CAMNT_0024702381 /DNA_START=596 /DNA_END=958 /DNA_ORIENTATION=-